MKHTMWILPSKAADTIWETLMMDIESSMIEPSLRDEIREAQDEVRTVNFERVREILSELQEMQESAARFFSDTHIGTAAGEYLTELSDLLE